MAITKLPNDEDDPSPPQANSAARAETIRKACRQITDLDAKRKAISAEMAEVKQTLIKGDLGMKIADFALALRVYQLEGEDRDTLFDTLRETFDALGVGEQLGFLDALQPSGEGAYDA
jgi:hypothetical protein